MCIFKQTPAGRYVADPGRHERRAPVPPHRKEMAMKKIVAALLVASVLVGALAALGCGGAADQAKTYMDEGDELSRQMSTLTDEAVFNAAALLAELGIEVSETGTIDPQTVTDAANKRLDKTIANGEKAKAEYEKILDLNDVEAYKDYARQRIAAIDSTIAVLEAVQGLLDKIGDPENKASISDTIAQWAKSNLEVTVDAVKAFSSWRSAEKIKEENNLGPVEEETEDSAPSGSTK